MPELTIGTSALLTDLALVVNRYRLLTPGIYVCVHVPVTAHGTRVVPGLVSMVNHGPAKQCEPSEDGFHGPPNFVLDVFAVDEIDEYDRRRDLFAEMGVVEYVAAFDHQQVQLKWNRRDDNAFHEARADASGLLKSKALPGLWIDIESVARRDWWSVLSTVERGCSRRGHHEFMEAIWHKDGRTAETEIPYDAS